MAIKSDEHSEEVEIVQFSMFNEPPSFLLFSLLGVAAARCTSCFIFILLFGKLLTFI